MVELFVAGLALVIIGVALCLSALGLITIPEGLYSALAAIALAAIGTRAKRVGQKRALKKHFDPDASDADPEGAGQEVDEDDEEGG